MRQSSTWPQSPPCSRRPRRRGAAFARQLTKSTVLSAQVSILDISADLPSAYFPRRSTRQFLPCGTLAHVHWPAFSAPSTFFQLAEPLSTACSSTRSAVRLHWREPMRCVREHAPPYRWGAERPPDRKGRLSGGLCCFPS